MIEQIIDDLRSELATTQLNCDMWHDRAEDMRNRLSVAQTEKATLCTRIDELCQEVEVEKQHNTKLLEAAEKWMAKAAHFELENTKLRELTVSYDSALHRMCNQMQGHVDCHDCILGKDYSDDWCAIDELREAVYLVKVDLDD